MGDTPLGAVYGGKEVWRSLVVPLAYKPPLGPGLGRPVAREAWPQCPPWACSYSGYTERPLEF